jgi:carboxypeptidase C (cathepsin A)
MLVLAVVWCVVNTLDNVLASDTNTKSSTKSQQPQQQQQRRNKAKISKDDFRVIGLETVEPAYSTFDGLMYAGLLTTELLYNDDDNLDNDDSTNNGQLMFWYFEPNTPTYDDTLVIWLNGGPGCSSLGGCLFEHCPVTIPLHPSGYYSNETDPFVLLPNDYTWTKATKMLYVEQPQSTGFSTGRVPQNETELSQDFYNFLQNFYTLFSELRSNRLYFFCESYAGMYVPSIAYYIHQQNEQSIYPYINLQGIGLGNGWIDATVQGPAVIDYAHWHGMIDSNTATALHNEWYNCQIGQATTDNSYNEFHEYTIPDECGIMSAVLNAAGANQVSWGSPNAYDIATWDK